jgi:hypothetical protein
MLYALAQLSPLEDTLARERTKHIGNFAYLAADG